MWEAMEELLYDKWGVGIKSVHVCLHHCVCCKHVPVLLPATRPCYQCTWAQVAYGVTWSPCCRDFPSAHDGCQLATAHRWADTAFIYQVVLHKKNSQGCAQKSAMKHTKSTSLVPVGKTLHCVLRKKADSVKLVQSGFVIDLKAWGTKVYQNELYLFSKII